MNVRTVLARGAIRVDARRAVAKLREHLLVDLHGYILELVRAAVVAKATGVRVDYDADDVYVRFDGNVCNADDIGHLLDFALASSDDARGRQLRLLAIGVNAALGLGPSFVDVYAGDAQGNVRVRFEPARLEDTEQEDSLASIVDAQTPPDQRGVAGTCVHVRRSWSWAELRRAVTAEPPPEVRLLSETPMRANLELSIQGVPVVWDRGEGVVARCVAAVPWPCGVELLRAGAAPPAVVFHELGVRLFTEPWSPWERADVARGDTYVPLRAYVDADALPTNASRSALRADASSEALRASLSDSLVRCLSGVAAVLSGQPAPGWLLVLEREPEQLAAALLGAAVAQLTVAERLEGGSAQGLRELLSAPLLRNGIGGALSPQSVLNAIREGERVYSLRTAAPLVGEYGPGIQRVVWMHVPYAEAIVAALPIRDASEILDDLKLGQKRRKQLLSRPASAPCVPPLRGELSRSRFCVESGELAGLHGELCLVDPAEHRGLRVRYYAEGRMIASELVEGISSLPIDAALAWDGRIVASLAYDAAEPNGALRSAVEHLGQLAIQELRRACRLAAARMMPTSHALSHALRRAIVAEPRLAEEPDLASMNAWPTAAGEMVSLGSVKSSPRPACTVTSSWLAGRTMTTPDGSPLLVLSPEYGEVLKSLVPTVPYERWLELAARRGPDAIRSALRASLVQELERQRVPIRLLVWFEGDSVSGYIAPSLDSNAVRHHMGQTIAVTIRPPPTCASTVSVEEPGMVPPPDAGRMVWPTIPNAMQCADRKLCNVVLDLLEGKRTWAGDDVHCDAPLDVVARHALLHRFLLSFAVKVQKRCEGDAELEAMMGRLERLCLVGLPQEQGDVSLRDLRTRVRGGEPAGRLTSRIRDAEQQGLVEILLVGARLQGGTKPASPPPPPFPPKAPAPPLVLAPAPPQATTPQEPLSAAFARAVGRLPSAPACGIATAHSGPVVRFSQSESTLYVRRDHPAMRAVLERNEPHLLPAVSAAFLSEINRELEVVTDAEERRALVELLQDWAVGL